jgi:putative SOS response-associated peptidase YedK
VCNLYSLNTPRAGIARFFRVSHNRAAAYEPLPAIFPGRVAPVVRQSADGEREITLMSWGFVLLQNGKAPKRVTNVRDDKIRANKFWRGSFEERRCLVPASSFLRAQRRCEACDLALVCPPRHGGTSVVSLPRHLAALPGSSAQGRPHCRS